MNWVLMNLNVEICWNIELNKTNTREINSLIHDIALKTLQNNTIYGLAVCMYKVFKIIALALKKGKNIKQVWQNTKMCMRLVLFSNLNLSEMF